MNSERKNILVITLSNIGDVILTTPVISSLKSFYPDASLTVVVGPKAKELLEGSRMIDNVIVYNKRVSLLQKLSFLHLLRKKKYDFVVDLRNTAIPFLVSAKKRSPLKRSYCHTSMRERHLEVLGMTGLPTKEAVPFDFFSDKEMTSALDKLKSSGVKASRWICVHAGAASEAKRWPLENFAYVIEKILEITDDPIILTGDASERLYVEPLRAVLPRRVHNLAGVTSLRETAALLSLAPLLLSNDTATMHLGYELDKNVVAVFGPTEPLKYGRRGKHFKLFSPSQPHSKEPVSDPFYGVRRDDVFTACRELLGNEAKSAHDF